MFSQFNEAGDYSIAVYYVKFYRATIGLFRSRVRIPELESTTNTEAWRHISVIFLTLAYLGVQMGRFEVFQTRAKGSARLNHFRLEKGVRAWKTKHFRSNESSKNWVTSNIVNIQNFSGSVVNMHIQSKSKFRKIWSYFAT